MRFKGRGLVLALVVATILIPFQVVMIPLCGYEKIQKSLAEIIDLKLVSKRLPQIKGVLIHGPSGVGKSLLILS